MELFNFLNLDFTSFNTIPLSLIWNLNQRKDNDLPNLVPLSPSEGGWEHVLCHRGGRGTCYLAWAEAGRGVPKTTASNETVQNHRREALCLLLCCPSSVSPDGCSLLQADVPARGWRPFSPASFFPYWTFSRSPSTMLFPPSMSLPCPFLYLECPLLIPPLPPVSPPLTPVLFHLEGTSTSSPNLSPPPCIAPALGAQSLGG